MTRHTSKPDQRLQDGVSSLEMALWRRRIKTHSDRIHHSDSGSRYVSIRYTDRLSDIGASALVGSVADPYDNAMAEALNGTFKAEPIELPGHVVQRRTPARSPRLHTARRVRT
ncbi:hypothetical protein ACFXKS_39300 [Streptomyces scopuliridis]|uniref:hypothetical protein n=1 Tax=Streptomyces scopuliridis TaxID=452529 RepID=UPI00369ADF5E